jgi:ferredoxin-NADP reductase
LLAARNTANTHYYACGPAVILDAFENHCQTLGCTQAHIERFSAAEVAAASDAKQTYTVELKRSGEVIAITPDISLLTALQAANQMIMVWVSGCKSERLVLDL